MYNNKASRGRPEMAEKIRALELEFVSFYDFCDRMEFSKKEMEEICSPLKMDEKKLLRRVLVMGLILFCLISGAQLLGDTAPVLGRIVLIKALSFWDWRYLYNEPCLVENPLYKEYSLTDEDCWSCESLTEINVVEEISYRELAENYLDLESPVIVRDGIRTESHLIHHDNVTQLYLKDEKLVDTIPCTLKTNLRHSGPDISVLKSINNSTMKKWFIHWRNCDINAVKAFRRFYSKPYFLPKTSSPEHFSWLLMSSHYNTRNFKKLELGSGLIMLMQLKGGNEVKLSPVNPCDNFCAQLHGHVQSGEILVFKNYIWNVEYLPEEDSDNIAILTEAAWDG